MSLTSIFFSLTAPEVSSPNLFNVMALTEFPFAKIGINNNQFPIILIASTDFTGNSFNKNIRLKYLELTFNAECKISELGQSTISNFTIIVLKSEDVNLITYFLRIAETFLKSLSHKPTRIEIANAFKSFVEIFRALSNPPTKTLQGLCAELLIISTSRNTETLLNHWHNIPEEKFDFNADNEKLEVKSSSTMERIHTFSSEQLNPQIDKQVLIASVFMKPSSTGRSIMDLVCEIKIKLKTDQLIGKVYTIIAQTLGSTLDEAVKVKFDLDLAKNSLRYYRHQDIDKIERVHIPSKVIDVRFKSDLSLCRNVELSKITNKGILFSAL